MLGGGEGGKEGQKRRTMACDVACVISTGKRMFPCKTHKRTTH